MAYESPEQKAQAYELARQTGVAVNPVLGSQLQQNPGVITPNSLTNTQPFPLVQPAVSPVPTFSDFQVKPLFPDINGPLRPADGGFKPYIQQIPGLNLQPGEKVEPMVIQTYPPTYIITDGKGGRREFQPQYDGSGGPLSGATLEYLDGVPKGWDKTTYANFKAANPTLEPDAQDTRLMLEAGDEYAPTPKEREQSAAIGELRDLNRQKVGKSAYQREQDTKFGVDAAQANINDLTSQLTALKNEAAAIPLQLQKQAEGKAITNSVLGAQENARLRTNAIAALGVSTLLAASQGQLANAQAMADKAVAAKYDPIQERIDALRENLDLIIQDPKTSLEEKNRAQAQKDIQDKKSEEVAKQKEESKEIWNIATDAASNSANFTPTTKYKTTAQALDAISKATSKEEALQIAVDTGFIAGESVETQIIQLDDGRDVVVNKNTGDIVKVIGGGSTKNVPKSIKNYPAAPENPDNSGFDLSTVDGIVNAVTKGGDNLADIRQYLDTNTKLTADSINSLIKEAEKKVGPDTSKQFLNKDYFKSVFTTSQLKASAKTAGFTKGGFLGIGVGEEGVNDYLNYLEGLVKQYRTAGYSDQEILKMMQ